MRYTITFGGPRPDRNHPAAGLTTALMQLVVFGLNHRTAPLEVRERWAFSPEESLCALGDLRGHVSASEHAILSTCNRTEVYSYLPVSFLRGEVLTIPPRDAATIPPRDAATILPRDAATILPRDAATILPRGAQAGPAAGQRPRPGPAPPALHFYEQVYREASRIFEEKAREHLEPSHYYVHRQESAVEHLFRLAGGLDSMILGESQILKQIKDAYAIAQSANTAGKFFHRLFPAALRVGKRVRAVTPISEGCITPGQAALELTREALGGLAGRSLLVIGSGKIGTSAAMAFRDEPLGSYHVMSRSLERARELVEKIGRGEPVEWSRLAEMLARADIVVSSTGSIEPIAPRGLLEEVAARRGRRPMVIVDLAIPRDFDPGAAEVIPDLRLLNIDDLNMVIQENVAERHAHIPVVEAIIRQELQSFHGWMTYRLVDPVLKHLVDRFEQIRLGELQAFISQFPPEYHPLVNELTSALMKKLLHFPIEKLKSLRDAKGLNETEIAFLRRLFLDGL
jgi:glutamyl-tRNA reductase